MNKLIIRLKLISKFYKFFELRSNGRMVTTLERKVDQLIDMLRKGEDYSKIKRKCYTLLDELEKGNRKRDTEELVKLRRKLLQELGINLEHYMPKVRLETVVKNIKFMASNKLSFDTLQKLSQRFSRWIEYNVEEAFKELKKTFSFYTPINRNELLKLFVKYPSLLGFKYQIRKKCIFFLQKGRKPNEIKLMIKKFPELIGRNLEGTIKPKYEYAEKENFVDETIKFPAYYGYDAVRIILRTSIEKVKRKGRKRSLSYILREKNEKFASLVGISLEEYKKLERSLRNLVGVSANGGEKATTKQIFKKWYKVEEKFLNYLKKEIV